MTDKFPEYNNIFDSDQLSFTFSDPAPDGDRIDVKLNDQIVAEDLELTGQGSTVDLPPLTTGPNKLTVVSKNAGTVSTSNQIRVDVPTDNNLYGDSSYTFTSMQGEGSNLIIGLPVIHVDGEQAPFAAQNIIDTLGEPVKLTIDRKDRSKRSKKNVKAYTEEFGLAPKTFDRDEAPPAVSVESGDDSTLPQNVRAIPGLDNQKAGGIINNFLKNYGPDNKTLKNDAVVEFYTSPPDYENEKSASKIIPIYGTDGADDSLVGREENNDLIYGFDGNDTINGDNPDLPGVPDGSDTLLGGRGNDSIKGAGGNDIVVGQPDDDLLFGDLGNDVVYGSPGNDVLYGDNVNFLTEPLNGKDRFILRRNEGIDLIRDFELGNDEIFLTNPTNFSSIGLRQISNGARPDGSPFVSELPDYPSLGSSRDISDSGTEIFLKTGKFIGNTLAYVENISASDLGRDSFGSDTKITLPDPL